MSDNFESDIKKYLATKNHKPVVQFKTANLLDEPAKNTVIQRRKVTYWLNKQLERGGFVVGDYWIHKPPNCKVYTATHMGAMSSDDLILLMCDILQCETVSIAHALHVNNTKLRELDQEIRRITVDYRTTNMIIKEKCDKCLEDPGEVCRRRTCPLWTISPRGSWKAIKRV